MSEIIQAIGRSVAEEKAKHLAGGGTVAIGGTTAKVHPLILTGDLSDILILLPYLATAAGFTLSVFLIYKTHLEIKLAKVRLAEERQEESDMQP